MPITGKQSLSVAKYGESTVKLRDLFQDHLIIRKTSLIASNTHFPKHVSLAKHTACTRQTRFLTAYLHLIPVKHPVRGAGVIF